MVTAVTKAYKKSKCSRLEQGTFYLCHLKPVILHGVQGDKIDRKELFLLANLIRYIQYPV